MTDEESIKNRIYYELLLVRYIPEIQNIEKGNTIPMKTEDFKKQLLIKMKRE